MEGITSDIIKRMAERLANERLVAVDMDAVILEVTEEEYRELKDYAYGPKPRVDPFGQFAASGVVAAAPKSFLGVPIKIKRGACARSAARSAAVTELAEMARRAL